jgi:hypothetical protein
MGDLFGRRSEADELRDAYITLASRNYRDYFLTLVVNHTMSQDAMRSLLSRFFGRVDRALLGRGFHTMPLSQRTDGVIFVEHAASNIHAHCLLEFPRGHAPSKLAGQCRKIWATLCPSGNAKLEIQYGGGHAADYATKETTRFNYDAADQIMLVGQFANSPADPN